MSVIRIRAHIKCDECGAQFSVGMDPSYEPPAKWSLWDVAEDAVRGSVQYEDKLWQYGLVSSVQDGKMLCKACTEKADARPD
jgi:hypothetical protein